MELGSNFKIFYVETKKTASKIAETSILKKIKPLVRSETNTSENVERNLFFSNNQQ